MGQIYKFRGSSINGDSEHFTVLKEDEWEKGNLCRQIFGWNEGSIKELEHAFLYVFTGTGWGVDLLHSYYPDLIVAKGIKGSSDRGMSKVRRIQFLQKWKQYYAFNIWQIWNRFRSINQIKINPLSFSSFVLMVDTGQSEQDW